MAERARRTAKARKAPAIRKTAARREPLADTPKGDAPKKARVEVCPRCGTEKFGPEERIRIDGRRTVRYTVLVCERGHTFARPISR